MYYNTESSFTMGPEQFLIDKIPNQPNCTSFLKTFEKELRNTRIKLLLGYCGSVLEGIFKYDDCTLRNLLCTVEINILLLWINRSFWSMSTKKPVLCISLTNKFYFNLNSLSLVNTEKCVIKIEFIISEKKICVLG